MDEFTRISQIEAQILNRYIKENYGVKVGWVALYGKKSCSAISRWLNKEYDFTSTALELLQEIT